ncbi:MAG: VOC family protein [Thermoanaerobaculia bacterium]|nr:VOC family protein [Thermoanaerobaculia bacterium]
MNIDQFRTVVRAKSFEGTCRFYGDVMGLPRLHSWDDESGRGARFQAGTGVIEVLGSAREGEGEEFRYQGPEHKLTLSLKVSSAEKAYEEMHFREKNIPGGLRERADGSLVFETCDPDGVKIHFVEA